jgi:hypothetical protein
MPSTCSSSEVNVTGLTKSRLGPAFLIVYVALGAICLPLLLAVFYFSTARVRRTPLFVFVVFDVIFGVAISCWMSTITVRHASRCLHTGLTKLSQLRLLLNPLSSHSRTDFIVIPILTFVGPWVVDLVLLLRLYAVFPVATTRRRTICAVFAFTVSVKAARLGCDITQAVQWVPTVGQDPWTVLNTAANVQSAHSSLLKAALACDLIDHTCVQLVHLDANTQG